MHLYVWKGEENTNICIHMYEEADFYKQNQLSGNNMQWPDIISLRVPGFPVMPDYKILLIDDQRNFTSSLLHFTLNNI